VDPTDFGRTRSASTSSLFVCLSQFNCQQSSFINCCYTYLELFVVQSHAHTIYSTSTTTPHHRQHIDNCSILNVEWTDGHSIHFWWRFLQAKICPSDNLVTAQTVPPVTHSYQQYFIHGLFKLDTRSDREVGRVQLCYCNNYCIT